MSELTPVRPTDDDLRENDLREAEQHAVEPLRRLFAVNRRDLFKFLGAGLVVGVCRASALAQESGRGRSEEIPHDIASWLHIGADGKITIFTGKVEMGQNIRTSLAQQVAEELRTQTNSVTMIMGDTDLTPFDLGTFGSRSTPQMGSQLRKVAAAAREMLLDMAAEHWQTDRSSLVAHDGAITNPHTKESFSYSELTRGQKLVKIVADDSALTPATQWHVAGTSAPLCKALAALCLKPYTSTMAASPIPPLATIVCPASVIFLRLRLS